MGFRARVGDPDPRGQRLQAPIPRVSAEEVCAPAGRREGSLCLARGKDENCMK